MGLSGRHSLVTPIDWKLSGSHDAKVVGLSRHSLVTPIDWKPYGWGLQSRELKS